MLSRSRRLDARRRSSITPTLNFLLLWVWITLGAVCIYRSTPFSLRSPCAESCRRTHGVMHGRLEGHIALARPSALRDACAVSILARTHGSGRRLLRANGDG